jgi:hypothetical protein
MEKAIESFKSYLITESYKGPEQLRLAQNLYQRPEIFKTEFDYRGINLYDNPDTIDDKDTGMSEEDHAQLKAIGLVNSTEIEYLSGRKLELEYDMIVDWTSVGIDRIIFIPKRMKLVIEVETWNEVKNETVTTTIEIIDDNIGDRFEWDFTRQYFPIEPTSVEIHMNESFDTSQFRYEFMIGEW